MVGLATYGYKIMRVIGVKAVKLSNVRGFSAELSTAIVVMVASRYGLPISTTQARQPRMYSSQPCLQLLHGLVWCHTEASRLEHTSAAGPCPHAAHSDAHAACLSYCLA